MYPGGARFFTVNVWFNIAMLNQVTAEDGIITLAEDYEEDTCKWLRTPSYTAPYDYIYNHVRRTLSQLPLNAFGWEATVEPILQSVRQWPAVPQARDSYM